MLFYLEKNILIESRQKPCTFQFKSLSLQKQNCARQLESKLSFALQQKENKRKQQELWQQLLE